MQAWALLFEPPPFNPAKLTTAWLPGVTRCAFSSLRTLSSSARKSGTSSTANTGKNSYPLNLPCQELLFWYTPWCFLSAAYGCRASVAGVPSFILQRLLS